MGFLVLRQNPLIVMPLFKATRGGSANDRYRLTAVPRFTETKPKYRNETEIPKQTIKNIGKMHIVNAGTKWITKYFPKYIIHKHTYSIKSSLRRK